MSFVMLTVRESLTTVVYWTMGGLTGASWGYVAMILPMFVVGAAVPFAFSRELNLMLLGDERAGQLGVPVERFKLLALGIGSLLTAAAVAVPASSVSSASWCRTWCASSSVPITACCFRRRCSPAASCSCSPT